MADVADLVDQVRAALNGYSAPSESFTILTGPINSTDLIFNVAASENLNISAGVVEIGSELLFLTNVDVSTGVCTAVGRGYDGTAATTHPAGARVTSSPRVPRRDVLRAINDCLSDLSPALFAVEWVTATGDGATSTFTVPEGTLMVKAAQRQVDTRWKPIPTWRVQQAVITGDDAGVELPYVPSAGEKLRFAVATPPVAFDSERNDLLDHGVPVDLRSILLTACLLKLTPSSELDRLQINTVEQSDRSRVVAASAGLTASRYLQLVLDQDRRTAIAALNVRYPKRIVRSF